MIKDIKSKNKKDKTPISDKLSELEEPKRFNLTKNTYQKKDGMYITKFKKGKKEDELIAKLYIKHNNN